MGAVIEGVVLSPHPLSGPVLEPEDSARKILSLPSAAQMEEMQSDHSLQTEP